MWSTSWFGAEHQLLPAAVPPLSVALALCIWTNVMHCYAERAPTPEVKKATALPPSSHKSPPVEQRPITFQNTQRPLPPTPEDNKLPEKSSSEYQPIGLCPEGFCGTVTTLQSAHYVCCICLSNCMHGTTWELPNWFSLNLILGSSNQICWHIPILVKISQE
jgi:hypothetical protein